MDDNLCGTCVYYRQHYTFDRRKIFRVNCGHCTCQRVKVKRPNTKACAHYLAGEALEESFATREYLSKELLEYILKLELLPEIVEIEK